MDSICITLLSPSCSVLFVLPLCVCFSVLTAQIPVISPEVKETSTPTHPLHWPHWDPLGDGYHSSTNASTKQDRYHGWPLQGHAGSHPDMRPVPSRAKGSLNILAVKSSEGEHDGVSDQQSSESCCGDPQSVLMFADTTHAKTACGAIVETAETELPHETEWLRMTGASAQRQNE